MAITVQVQDSHVSAKFEAMLPRVRQALVDALTPLETRMLEDARSRAEAHIRFLGAKPGAYLQSITGGVSSKENRVTAYVRSGHPLAHILESGASVLPHEILPNAAMILAFDGDAETVFAKVVHSPGAKIPAYPAIHPAFEALRDEIETALKSVAKSAAGSQR